MQRRKFVTLIGASMILQPFRSLSYLSNSLPENGELMPVLFVGHGSPMNGIEDNEFSRYWTKLAQEIVRPTTVLCISAHWLTSGTYMTAMPSPRTIHDFGGFPQALYDVQYPAPGNPDLVSQVSGMIQHTQVLHDHDWGLDHGTWTVVRHMYPEADIPVLQLSIDIRQPASFHYQLGKSLADLRRKGVLIIGSGNMVHNLGMVAWDRLNQSFGYDWAIEMNTIFKEKITNNDHQALIQYESLNSAARLAIPTVDHYYPLLYTLGLKTEQDNVQFFNDKAMSGSLTMTSVRIG